MEIGSIAAAATQNAATNLHQAVSVSVLKKAIDMQSENALALLQALPTPQPQPASVPIGTSGGTIDTYA